MTTTTKTTKIKIDRLSKSEIDRDVTDKTNRVVLSNISWSQFENILINLGDHRVARIAYDQGILEIMSPSVEHEYYKEAIGLAIQDIAEVLQLDYESLGSTTWKRELRQAGVEADNCFYFQNEPSIRGKLEYDLNEDPPPDLALEIDLTSKSLNRFSIYARLGVPEIWCYDGGVLTVYQLDNENYLASETSSIFPTLPVQAIPEIIEQNRALGRLAIRRAVREWVLKNLPLTSSS